MKPLPWPDEKKAREARLEAVTWLRNAGYSWRQIARAMNSTRVKVEGDYYKLQRRRRKESSELERKMPTLKVVEMAANPYVYGVAKIERT